MSYSTFFAAQVSFFTSASEHLLSPFQLDPHLVVSCMSMWGRLLLSLFWLFWLCLMEVLLQSFCLTKTNIPAKGIVIPISNSSKLIKCLF